VTRAPLQVSRTGGGAGSNSKALTAIHFEWPVSILHSDWWKCLNLEDMLPWQKEVDPFKIFQIDAILIG